MPIYYLLIVDAPKYCVGAVWRKDGSTWTCVEAAPIIRWMLHMNVDRVGEYLKSKGYKWEWIREDFKK